MGNGIAHVFAQAGYSVILRDVDQKYLDRALDTIGKNLDREVKKGKSPKPINPPLSPASKSSPISKALAAADIAVEAVPEQRDLKERVLKEADAALRPAQSSPATPPPSPSPHSPQKPAAPKVSSACTS